MLLFYLSMIKDEEDKGKFEIIYNTYRNLMLNRAYEILQDKSLVEDAVQEAFLRIIKNITKINMDNSHKTKGYVVVVLENVAKNMYNKSKKIVTVGFEEDYASADFTEELDRKNEAEYIAKLIELLPDAYRDVLVLKYINDFSDKEIASALGISNANARKRLERARNALKNLIESSEENG